MKYNGSGYKKCRKYAGLTQEQVAEIIHKDVRTLQAYEAGAFLPDDETIDLMCTIFNTPTLAHWHIRENTKLGKYMPEVALPQTHGDMWLQMSLAADEIKEERQRILKILHDGQITEDEYPSFRDFLDAIFTTSGRLLSISMYGDIFLKDALKNADDLRLQGTAGERQGRIAL